MFVRQDVGKIYVLAAANLSFVRLTLLKHMNVSCVICRNVRRSMYSFLLFYIDSK